MFVQNIFDSQGHQIGHSLRLRSSNSAYLNRTFGTPTDNKRWTWSGWVKRGAISGSTSYALFNAGSVGTNEFVFGISNDAIYCYQISTSVTTLNKLSSLVLRDPGSWFHLMAIYDSANGTAEDRFIVYLNGVRVTSWGTNTTLPLNQVGLANSAIRNSMGIAEYTSRLPFDGYLSEINFVDGQALTPASFGQTDSATGQWTPKQYSGTYGTNGFYLPFSNGTSLTTLGADASGNGNNWTLNNISLTAGRTYDWMLDTPTSNYATLNYINLAGGATLSSANLLTTVPSTSAAYSTSTVPCAGKIYVEFGGESFATSVLGVYCANTGGTAQGILYASDGRIYSNNVLQGTFATYSSGDIIALTCDESTRQIAVYKNNIQIGTTYTANGTDPLFFGVVGSSAGTGNGSMHTNFGQRPFTYTPPSGFKSLNTSNLVDPSILKPSLNFNVALDTGANIKSTTEALFPSDFFEWIKDRANSNNHQLIDSVRGSSAVLQSNTTAAETTYSAPSGSSVGWAWKAGGAAVSNSAGSITSQVSANTQAGFSIVTYTGTGANATVGHGLGVAPKQIIIFKRTGTVGAGQSDHVIYHASQNAAPASGGTFLNLTNAFTASSGYWNSTPPASSVFSVGASQYVSEVGATYVAYCFAEVAGYSKIGSYTGNGSADGPFVYCGFRPRFVLIKRVDAAGFNWVMYDTARDIYNVVALDLYPNTTGAESSGVNLDIVSNGFKIRAAGGTHNASGGTYIFYAVPEQTFKYANAR